MATEWYRSSEPAAVAIDPPSRWLRRGLTALLPERKVAGKVMVLYNRRGFRKVSAWPGLFSEFHSVLGALKYSEQHGAAGVRIDYRSPNYLDPSHGPNWWVYFFERALMPTNAHADRGAEIHLDTAFARYGRYGGFCDLVNGPAARFYPITYGLSREELHRLISQHIRVRTEIREKVATFVRDSFAGAYVVGVHYRGTDSAGRHFPYYRIPYDDYIAEVRRCVDRRAPGAHRVFVATDERGFLEAMRREFDDAVVCWEGSPRTDATALPIHFDAALPVSNYTKGETAVIDALLLAETDYLVKGRSNLSDASLAFNPRLPYSFCIR